jgi:hypothetical protein
MPKKRLKELPLPRLYNYGNELNIPEVDPDMLHRPVERMPEYMRITLNALSSIFPIDIGEFAHRHRRMLVVDRNTIAELKNRHDGYITGGKKSGFLYCYSFENDLIAGHYKEPHEDGMLWWYRSWETHHFLPNIKIGKTGRTEFQERVLEQFSGPRIGVGHSQKAILLFLLYSPRVESDGLSQGLETKVHCELKKRKKWLKNAAIFDDISPGKEWFEVNVGEAYSIAVEHNRKIYEECRAVEEKVSEQQINE